MSELNIYPVKSLGGYSVAEALVTETGFQHDRRWMLIDENNKFITQREFHAMALLVATVTDEVLHISHKHKPELTLKVPVVPEQQTLLIVEVWGDYCQAQQVSYSADEWLSDVLNIKCRLVYMPSDTKRMVDDRYAHNKEITTFTDGYPFMMISQESLNDLNTRLSTPLPMDRFRPNIVFTGAEPYEEDLFEHFNIGAVEFWGVKLCARCVVTTINQQTIERSKEPLKTLAGYRSGNNKIYFGQNLLHKGDGIIKTGGQITLLKKKAGAVVTDISGAGNFINI